MRIFLSHSSHDKPRVQEFAKILKARGFDCWIDEAEIKIGESLIYSISNAISEIDYVLVFLTTNSVSSHWVRYELQLAMTDEVTQGKIKVLPVLLESCDIPNFLKMKKYADLSTGEKWEAVAEKISNQLITTDGNSTLQSSEIDNDIDLGDFDKARASFRVTEKHLFIQSLLWLMIMVILLFTAVNRPLFTNTMQLILIFSMFWAAMLSFLVTAIAYYFRRKLARAVNLDAKTALKIKQKEKVTYLFRFSALSDTSLNQAEKVFLTVSSLTVYIWCLNALLFFVFSTLLAMNHYVWR